MYQNILFDLDGTLTDPGIGITNSVMHALKKFDIIEEDRTRLYKFIGPPLLDSFMEYYGLTKAQAEQAIVYYREYFRPYGLYENEVYEGTREMLERLKAAGRTIILATSKPEEFAKEILRYFDLEKYFDHIAGASMDEKRNKKGDVILYALDNCRITDLSQTIMVGDREHDVLGAKQAGLDCIGVLFGYGDREELAQAGAKYIAEDVHEILDIILSEESEN